MVLLLGAETAQAQTAVKLIGNQGQTTQGQLVFLDRAQAFTTGSNTNGGFVLTRVDLRMRSGSGNAPTFTVSVHNNSSGKPGTSLGTLTQQGSIPSSEGAVRFNASASGISLSSGTTYWVVIDVSVTAQTYRNFRATTDSEDPGGATGWSIGNDHITRGTAATDWSTTLTDSHSLAVDIYGYAKTAPTVANAIPDQAAVAGTAFSYAFPDNTFNDADGDTLTYTAAKSDGTALPSWLTFTGSTRTFAGTPQTGDTGTVSVKVTASDGANSVSDTFDIVVKATNSAPTVANPIPDQSVDVAIGFDYTFPANTFNDADGDTLTYTATSADGTALPPWLTFEAIGARSFFGVPGPAHVGTYSIKVTATDGIASVSDTFDIVVPQAQVPPTVTGVAVSSTPLFDTDNNGTPETYGLNGKIEVQLAFSEAVTVTGTPRLKIKMDPNFGEFWANYESGSGATALFFAYTVVSPNTSTQGIAVLENTLELNGGTIRAGTTNATLTHTGLAHDAGHKVDSTLTGTPQTPDPTPPPATPPGTPPGTGAPSASSPDKAPRAVGLRVVDAGPDAIRLSWKLTDGGRRDRQGYSVYRCTVADGAADDEPPCDPYDGWWVGAPSDANAWTDTDVTPGATYRYTVSAAPYGRDEQSRAVTVTAQAPTGPPPSAPTGLAVTEAGTTHVRLHWQAPEEDGSGPLQGIDVYRCNVDADPDCDDYLLLASRSAAAPARFTDNDDVAPGTTYRYAVGANRGADVPAPWSAPVTARTAPAGAPPVGVSPARAAEAPGAALVFRVSLGKAADNPVTVDYATLDGTATAGEDYTAVSGTLTFAPGERIRRIKVPVLDDAHDEGEETLELTLSNASGAWLNARAASATGTIENADPLPKAWLGRFGRTGAVHIVDILDSRFDAAAPTGDRLVLGGRAVELAALRAGAGGQGVADGDPVSHWMPEPVRHDGEEAGGVRHDGELADQMAPPPAGESADATVLERALWQTLTHPGALDMDKRFLSQSSFHMSLTDPFSRDEPDTEAIETARAAPEHPGHWSLWGRGAMTRFQGAEDGVNLDGEVLTGLLGLDYARDRWLAGVALAYHDGDGGYRAGNDTGGDLDSTLITVNPYLRYALTPRLSVWGTLGYGTGSMELTPTSPLIASVPGCNPAGGYRRANRQSCRFVPRTRESSGQGVAAGDSLSHWMPGQARHGTEEAGDTVREAQPIETDMSMSMGALGLRGVVYANAHTELALKSDALWVRTASEETDGLQGAVADTSRIRLLLSGQHQRALPNNALLSPNFELGIRYDDGDAETGFGMELGGGLRYTDAARGLTVETRARTLLAHEDGGYEEWGLGGSLALDPGRLGRGLALRLDSGWGIAQSNAEALWQRRSTAGIAPQQGQAAQARLNAELGYGLDVPWTYAILTPYGGMEWAGPRRALRLGWRFDLGQRLSLSFEGERMESGYERADHSLMLRTSLPW